VDAAGKKNGSAIFALPIDLFNNRGLIKSLAINDFKKRYAGSYLGIVWALAQPIVTVLMYWLVFDKIFGAKAQRLGEGLEVPYVLFLTAGLVPWFYFLEALMNGATSLLEYNYLVKKVVFKISILPLIKIIAAAFIHMFFVLLTLGMAAYYGYYPGVNTLWLLYYFACMFFLVLAISFVTSSVSVFFRDMIQIISIALQLGQWATPILWNIEIVPENYRIFLMINPVVYIVDGYRYAICGGDNIFFNLPYTIYFWVLSIAIFVLGAVIFKRTKPHFADVL